jgi:class 3 adenylate cyclase
MLFAEVKGSVEFSGRVDPEQWHEIMDRFLQILTDGVHRFKGTGLCNSRLNCGASGIRTCSIALAREVTTPAD